MIEVAESNETMVFKVKSETKKGKDYRVDLLAQNGFGQCSCTDWGTRRWPNMKPGAVAGMRGTACKHVLAARRHFLNGLLADMAKSESQS